MKKLFTFLILLTTTVAYAGPSVAPSFDGELRWGDGRRFVGYVAENVWTDPTTFWLTSSVNAGFTLNYEDREFVFLANGTFTIDLDAAATLGDGFSFVVKNVGVGTITIDPNGAETIDGAATLDLPNQYDTAFVVTDGTSWHIVDYFQGALIGTTLWTRDVINGYLYPSTLTDDVGIGTSTPNELLHINGSSTIARLQMTNAVTGSTANDGALFGFNNLDLYFYSRENAPIYFGTNDNVRMTITGSGNVGINTATPDRRLDVLDATDPQIRATHTDAAIYSEWQTTGDGIGRFTGTGNAFLFPAGDILIGPSVMIGYTDTGFVSNDQNLGLYESGKLVLDISDTIKEYRVPSDFHYGWSSATDNKSGTDTTLSRPQAGTVQSIGTTNPQFRWTHTEGSIYGEVQVDASGITTLTTSGNSFVFPQGSATNPGIAIGDGDSGWYESSDDTMVMALGGVGWYNFNNSSIFSSSTGGFQISRLDSTATGPAYAFNNDSNTGIGTNGISELSLIANSKEGLRIVGSGVGTTVQMPHDSWLTAIDNAGTGTVNMFKVNTSDNVELGADMDVSGKLVTTADTIIPFIDVDITSAVSGTEVGYTMDVDGSNVVAVLGDSDGAGGSNGEYVKFYGGEVKAVTLVNAATYDTTLSDSVLHVTYTGTGAVTSLTLMTELCDETVDNGRIIYIKDGAGNAGTFNITIDTEGAETIDGAATYNITANYNDVRVYCYSSNWFIMD